MAAVVQHVTNRYQSLCRECPKRWVAWTLDAVPMASAVAHNNRWHDGAPVEVEEAPGVKPVGLLP
jgi:hypothetical protein